MKEVVVKEVAEKEVTAWLDYKRIPEDVREGNRVFVNTLVRGVQYGDISINADTYEIKHKLSFPVEGLLSELVYRARLTVGDLQKATSSVKEIDAKIVGYISALTGKSISHLQRMDTEDFRISQSVAVFFM